jgi:hypothetical protein
LPISLVATHTTVPVFALLVLHGKSAGTTARAVGHTKAEAATRAGKTTRESGMVTSVDQTVRSIGF